eukprot:5396211-Prymnesium_polylepis.1
MAALPRARCIRPPSPCSVHQLKAYAVHVPKCTAVSTTQCFTVVLYGRLATTVHGGARRPFTQSGRAAND